MAAFLSPAKTEQHKPYQPVQGKRTWHVDSKGLDMTIPTGKLYKLVPAGQTDFEKVRALFLKSSPNGYDIASVEIIHNPTMAINFETRVTTLQERAGNAAFKPKWPNEKNQLELRTQVYKIYKAISDQHLDSNFPNVKFLPMWHGTKEAVIDSLCKTGFANLALTDSGYFGKGIYSSYEAEYSWRVYSKYSGVLVLLWNACFSSYPVVDGDMENLKGKGNFANHDAHFIPVTPQNPSNPNEISYIPCKAGQKATYHELVVFEQSQCFPRFIVRLQANLKKQISPVTTTNTSLSVRYDQAKQLLQDKKFDQAFAEFHALANAGLEKAYFYKGYCYLLGLGTSEDHVKAVKYLLLAIEKCKTPLAYYYLGVCAFSGKGCQKDTNTAYTYLDTAQKLGCTEAAEFIKKNYK